MPIVDYYIGFDPGSLEELVRLRGFGALLEPEIQQALKEASELMVTTARANTWEVFDAPSGALADSIYSYVISPTEVAVAVGVPYGARREWGFSGKTDSLGRTYINDPGKPYLIPALYEDQPLVAVMMEVAVNKALDRVAVV